MPGPFYDIFTYNPCSFAPGTGISARSFSCVPSLPPSLLLPTTRFLFYNKPNGMAHFLKNADPPVSEAIIALVDPDMVFMSPLTPNVGERGEGRGRGG